MQDKKHFTNKYESLKSLVNKVSRHLATIGKPMVHGSFLTGTVKWLKNNNELILLSDIDIILFPRKGCLKNYKQQTSLFNITKQDLKISSSSGIHIVCGCFNCRSSSMIIKYLINNALTDISKTNKKYFLPKKIYYANLINKLIELHNNNNEFTGSLYLLTKFKTINTYKNLQPLIINNKDLMYISDLGLLDFENWLNENSSIKYKKTLINILLSIKNNKRILEYDYYATKNAIYNLVKDSYKTKLLIENWDIWSIYENKNLPNNFFPITFFCVS